MTNIVQNLTIKGRSVDGVLGIRAWDCRMLGSDKSTELCRPPSPFWDRIWRWPDLRRGFLVLEATALPTEPLPQTYFKQQNYLFLKQPYFQFNHNHCLKSLCDFSYWQVIGNPSFNSWARYVFLQIQLNKKITHKLNGKIFRECESPAVWPEKNCQMSTKVAQKWFH